MKRFKLSPSKGAIVRKRKGLKFTPVAVQVGELPRERRKDEAK